jgi:hypothetical protein
MMENDAFMRAWRESQGQPADALPRLRHVDLPTGMQFAPDERGLLRPNLPKRGGVPTATARNIILRLLRVRP